MDEKLEVEGLFYLEEVSLTDSTSSRGTLTPLPVQIRPDADCAADGSF